MRGGRVLVTGATGFFGIWLLESLGAVNRELGLGLRVIAQSRNPAPFLARVPHLGPAAGIHWLKAAPEGLTEEALRDIPGGAGLDAIVHLVTEADNAAMVARPDLAEQSIVGSTRAALDLARRTGVRYFLFTSSGSVYANGIQSPHGRIDENQALIEASAGTGSGHLIGGICKRQSEGLCTVAAQEAGLHATIARCFTFAGPRMPLHGKFAFGNFLNDAIHGRDIIVQGDGTPIRSYLYAADLAAWLWTIMLRGQAGRAYNVGSEHAVSIRATAEAVRDIVAPTAAVTVAGGQSGGLNCYVPDTRRARTELDLRETVPLPEAIRRTASWVREDAQH